MKTDTLNQKQTFLVAGVSARSLGSFHHAGNGVSSFNHMKTIKYSDRATCPECGGMLAYDATVTRKLPLGFGFAPGSAKFQVDCVLQKGFRGECMECQAKVFAVKSSRHTTRFPKSINSKLNLVTP